ncbi:MAG: hypothetical protein AAF333_14950 [Planctomycetota bacterium]
MSIFHTNLTTRFVLLAALGIAALMAASHASAGTQMPPWKWQQMNGDAATNTSIVDNGMPGSNYDGDGEKTYDGGDGEIPNYNGDNGVHMGDGNSNPEAVPTPSAVAGGLAMIGLLAGRRRRQHQDD